MSIGIFDSGLGGLTVLKEIRKELPNEKIVYLGDTARVPYGEKTKELIVRYSKEIVDFLLEQEVDVIVVACNTATSLALDELIKTYRTPILGVIDAGVDTALKNTKNNKIGVIGTKATINSKKYEIEIKNKNKNIEVYSKACPLFVPIIEEGIIEGNIVDSVVEMYIGDFDGKIDSLILGCTHYPLLKETISKKYPSINIIDPAKETAKNLKEVLIKENLLKNDGKNENVKFFVTDGAEKFKKIGTMFLEKEILNVDLIKL